MGAEHTPTASSLQKLKCRRRDNVKTEADDDQPKQTPPRTGESEILRAPILARELSLTMPLPRVERLQRCGGNIDFTHARTEIGPAPAILQTHNLQRCPPHPQKSGSPSPGATHVPPPFRNHPCATTCRLPENIALIPQTLRTTWASSIVALAWALACACFRLWNQIQSANLRLTMS
jgi:hypothetical protein